MFWYIIICLTMLYLYLLVYVGKKNGKNAEKMVLKIACAVLFFFMAMRAISVGVDTKYYGFVFSQFQDISWSEIFTAVIYATESKTWAFEFEPGYRFVNKCISFLGDSPQIITFFNSAAIILWLYFLIKKESPNFMLSIWLYITLGVYQTEMNVTRNAIAIFIVYLSFRYIKEKKLVKYLVNILFAASFHKTALVFFPLYWILPKKTDLKAMTLLIFLGISIGISFPFIGQFIRAILPLGLDKYFTSSNEKAETLIVGALYAVLVFFVLFSMKKEERLKAIEKTQNGSWMFTLNLCFFGLNIGLGSAARMAALFGPYIILYIPQLLEEISSSKYRQQVTGLLVLGCGIQYLLRLLINNIGGTMPYEFFGN